MKIAFFNTYEPVNTFYRDLIPYLARKGLEIELIISGSEYRSGRGKIEDVLTHQNISVQYIPAPPFGARGRYAKAGIMASYSLGAIIRTLLGPKCDLHFFLSQPPFFSFFGFILKRLVNRPYACMIMDLYPEALVLDGVLKPDSLVTRLLRALTRITLNGADFVVVIGRCMFNKLSSLGVNSDNIHYIPNWTNDGLLTSIPKENNLLLSQLGLDKDFVVLYSGNMGVSHYFDDILEVARRCAHLERLRFLFIGDGYRRKEIESFVEKHRLGNVQILPYQPANLLSASLSLGDVHFVSLRHGFEGVVVPSKAYSSLAVGRPLIYQGSAAGEIARMIAEEGIGSVVPLGCPNLLEQTILKYFRNKSLTLNQGGKANNLSHSKYSYRMHLRKYADIIMQTIGNE